MAAIAGGKVAATDFDAARRQRLLEHRSADVRRKAAKAFAVTVDTDRQKVVAEYQSAVNLRATLSAGRSSSPKRAPHVTNWLMWGTRSGPTSPR